MQKLCNDCRVLKDGVDFPKKSASSDGLAWRCKACHREYIRRFRADPANALKIRNQQLKWNYGITLEDYEEMLEAQGGVCAICGKEETSLTNNGKSVKPLAVDHNEETGEVRGLLCTCCNTGIGQLGHDPERLASALAYVISHETETAIA